LLALLADIVAAGPHAGDVAKLRLRLIDPRFSWQALVDLAADQGMLLPLIWGLRRRSLLLPVPRNAHGVATDDNPSAVLERVHRRYLTRLGEQRDQLLVVLGALNRADIVPLLLKGARYLVAPIAPWCEARDMRDIDLLVRTDDASQAVEALASEGYLAETEFVPLDQHLPEMWLPGRPSAVEIHTHALAFSARKILATDDVWRYAVPGSVDRGSFLVLPEEWHLLHGLLNHQISDRGHVRCLLAVKALWEFAALGAGLRHQGWRSIADHMTGRGCADVLGSFIVQAEQLFGLVYPESITISPAARAHAEQTFAHAARPDLLRRGYFLADQFRHGFARETMAMRYGLAESDVSAGTIRRHVSFLVRRYRGKTLRRISGRSERVF
jgi:hypothetical protein